MLLPNDEVREHPVASSVVPRPRVGWRSRLRRDRVLLAMTVPGLLALITFHYLPLLGNIIAFEDYQPFIGIVDSQWVGLQKFTILFNGDPAFLNAVKNTLVLTLVQVIFVFPAPIALALMINSLLSERMRRIVQNVLYLPHFLSWVVVVAIFQQLLGGSGLLNTFLRSRGVDTLDIVGNPDLFFGLLTSQVVWKDSGWATILFLAALSQVDQSLYEASAIDGASRFQQLVNVTLPALRGVIVLLLILRLGDSLNVGFEQIILQQKAVGSEASEVIDTYVFNYGILGSDWGTSAAVGLVKGVIATILVVGANKLAHVFGEDGVYRA